MAEEAASLPPAPPAPLTLNRGSGYLWRRGDASANMNRRDFFRVSVGRRAVLDVDCQTLYRHYVDSRAEGTSQELLARLGEELRRASAIRLHQASWVSHSELGVAVASLLDEFRSRGGVIEYR